MIRFFVIMFAVFLCASSTARAEKESTPVPVVSFRTIDVTEFNAIIASAAKDGAAWPRNSFVVVSRLFELESYFLGPLGDDVLNYTKTKGSGEHQGSTVITVVRDGFKDDSVRGDWTWIRLKRQDGTWHVEEVRFANRCWRAKNTEVFSAERCL